VSFPDRGGPLGCTGEESPVEADDVVLSLVLQISIIQWESAIKTHGCNALAEVMAAPTWDFGTCVYPSFCLS